MDTITTAILTALSVGATDVGKQAVVDAYKALKKLIQEHFGANNPVVKAVADLEADRKSETRVNVLNEQIKATKADQLPELIEAAKHLLSLVDPKQASVSKFTVQAKTIQGVFQAETIQGINLTFGNTPEDK